jgi:hypothetical protein
VKNAPILSTVSDQWDQLILLDAVCIHEAIGWIDTEYQRRGRAGVFWVLVCAATPVRVASRASPTSKDIAKLGAKNASPDYQCFADLLFLLLASSFWRRQRKARMRARHRLKLDATIYK